MTTEIEKELYERYGASEQMYTEYDNCCLCIKECIFKYPVITAEKVLRLINILADMCYKISFSRNGKTKNLRRIVVEITECGENINKKFWICENKFKNGTENLCGGLIQLYNHLDQQERNEIKKVLNNGI